MINIILQVESCRVTDYLGRQRLILLDRVTQKSQMAVRLDAGYTFCDKTGEMGKIGDFEYILRMKTEDRRFGGLSVLT